MLLATRGRRFSAIETVLNLFHDTLEQWRQINSGEKTITQKVLEDAGQWTPKFIAEYHAYIQKSLADLSKQIGQVAVGAAVARDPAKVYELADAIKFLGTFRPHGDRIRQRLLELKSLDREKVLKSGTGKQWTIREVARLVEWPRVKSPDGFARLRRLCGELNFPLVPIKTSKQKKKA